ncbi:hypothetical protein [Caudoviricetes sp.]|nr:hypothetical protein [Caudoviricetes sp.]
MRRARADYFTRILRTTDSALSILGQTFTPSTLKWVNGTGNYQLPPDFLRMKLITDLSDDRVRIIGGDLAKNEFRAIMNSNAAEATREYLYDILGIRTLVIRPIPVEDRDIEYIYEKLLASLRDWTMGSVTVTNNSATVSFSSSAEIQSRLVAGDELILGTDGTTQATPLPDTHYPVILSIDSATQATLASVWLDASASDRAFRISSVSEIPPLHHDALVAYAAKEAFMKGTNPHMESVTLWQANYSAALASLIGDVEVRQGSDLENTQAYLEDYYDA